MPWRGPYGPKCALRRGFSRWAMLGSNGDPRLGNPSIRYTTRSGDQRTRVAASAVGAEPAAAAKAAPNRSAARPAAGDDVYGTWYQRTPVADDPALGEQIRETLCDLLPAVATSLAPPDRVSSTPMLFSPAPAPTRSGPFALNGLNSRGDDTDWRGVADESLASARRRRSVRLPSRPVSGLIGPRRASRGPMGPKNGPKSARIERRR